MARASSEGCGEASTRLGGLRTDGDRRRSTCFSAVRLLHLLVRLKLPQATPKRGGLWGSWSPVGPPCLGIGWAHSPK